EPSFSFEFFPPRTEEGVTQLFQTAAALRALEPSFVSITWGAGGSTRDRTIELVGRIKRELHIEAMAHLTGTRATRDDLAAVLDRRQADGIDNVLCLRGDPPKGQKTFVATENGFSYANELVEFAKERWPFCLGVAGNPEGHPESTDRYQDLLHLRTK